MKNLEKLVLILFLLVMQITCTNKKENLKSETARDLTDTTSVFTNGSNEIENPCINCTQKLQLELATCIHNAQNDKDKIHACNLKYSREWTTLCMPICIPLHSLTNPTFEEELKKQLMTSESISLNINYQTRDICYFETVPSGWVITNARWCASCCDFRHGPPINNVYTITNIQNLPIGTIIEICIGNPTPNGWEILQNRWCPTCCGFSGGLVYNNVAKIRKVR